MFKVEHLQDGQHAVVQLSNEQVGTQASILPGLGFNCFSFTCNVNGQPRNLLYTSDTYPSPQDKATHNGTPILAPFPNRIRAGQFRYRGHDYVLNCNEHGKNAIHGFAVDQPWRIVDEKADKNAAEVTGEFQLSKDRADYLSYWPSDFRVAFRYQLKEASLLTEIIVENPGENILPFGVGTHPYFRFPLDGSGSPAQCEIVCPVKKQVELDACLPTGRLADSATASSLANGMPLDQQGFDDVFCDLEAADDGKIHHFLRDHQAKVEMEIIHDAAFPYIVVYTPAHRQSICIEPYTCITDAINLEGGAMDTGLWHLHPGEVRHLTIEYRVRALS